MIRVYISKWPRTAARDLVTEFERAGDDPIDAQWRRREIDQAILNKWRFARTKGRRPLYD